jgi:hypothetical protein
MTQITGRRIYATEGTSSVSLILLIQEDEFNNGRRVTERNNPSATLNPSKSMDNSAKLTEKRLSISNWLYFDIRSSRWRRT